MTRRASSRVHRPDNKAFDPVRLTDADLPQIPLPAAWLDDDDRVHAATPEWRGAGPGTSVYRVGRLRLVVAPDDHDPDISTLCQHLVEELRAAAGAATGAHRRRMELLTAGLAMVAGTPSEASGTTADVAELLRAGVAVLNPPIDVVTLQWPLLPVAAPAATALALKQMIANAQRHDGAAAIRIAVTPGLLFRLQWRGDVRAADVRSSRHQALRERWGLGFVWQAADTLGGIALGPFPSPTDPLRSEMTLEVNPANQRLTLPLAAAGPDARIQRATGTWEQETRLLPGSLLGGQPAEAYSLAQQMPGAAVESGSFRARQAPNRTWICMTPAGARDRAIDVIRGLAHEHDLLRATEPYRTRLVALAILLRAALGERLPGWNLTAFRQQFRAACDSQGVRPPTLPSPAFSPAPDPMLAAYLVGQLGGDIRLSGKQWVLHPSPTAQNAVIARLLATQTGDVALTSPALSLEARG